MVVWGWVIDFLLHKKLIFGVLFATGRSSWDMKNAEKESADADAEMAEADKLTGKEPPPTVEEMEA